MDAAPDGDIARPVAERLDGAVAARSAHDSIASNFAISFGSRVVKEVTRRPRQLMDEPSPCSSMTSKSCQARDILSIKSFAQSTASATVALTGRSYFAKAGCQPLDCNIEMTPRQGKFHIAHAPISFNSCSASPRRRYPLRSALRTPSASRSAMTAPLQVRMASASGWHAIP